LQCIGSIPHDVIQQPFPWRNVVDERPTGVLLQQAP
jgi:hypothetical protein